MSDTSFARDEEAMTTQPIGKGQNLQSPNHKYRLVNLGADQLFDWQTPDTPPFIGVLQI